MAVIVCPVGARLILELEWPASARSLDNCTGLTQVRATPSGSATLLMSGTVTIDTVTRLITLTFDEDDTADRDEGSRGFMDFRLEWSDDGEVAFPLFDELVELEFTATITQEA